MVLQYKLRLLSSPTSFYQIVITHFFNRTTKQNIALYVIRSDGILSRKSKSFICSSTKFPITASGVRSRQVYIYIFSRNELSSHFAGSWWQSRNGVAKTQCTSSNNNNTRCITHRRSHYACKLKCAIVPSGFFIVLSLCLLQFFSTEKQRTLLKVGLAYV